MKIDPTKLKTDRQRRCSNSCINGRNWNLNYIDDDGTVKIAAIDSNAVKQVMARIDITAEVEAGATTR